MSPHAMQHAIETIGEGGLVSYDDVYKRMTRDNEFLMDLLAMIHESSLQEAERVFMNKYYDAARDEITAARDANLEIEAGLM